MTYAINARGGATGVAAPFRTWGIGGQVPNRERLQLMRLTAPAPKPGSQSFFDHNGPRFSIDSVLDGLGMEKSDYQIWRSFLKKALNQDDELLMRKDVMAKMMEERLNPELRRALFQRSLSFFRGRFQKSQTVEIVTIDELHKAMSGEDMEKYFMADKESMEKNAKESQKQTFLARNPGMSKAGPFIGPRGGKYADADHKIPWKGNGDGGGGGGGGGSGGGGKQMSSAAKAAITGIEKLINVSEGGEYPNPRDVQSVGISALAAVRENPKMKATMTSTLIGLKDLLEKKGVKVVDKVLVLMEKIPDLKKADAKGGSYHRRVTNKEGKHRYYYDEDKYNESKDAHVDGKSAAKKAITGGVQKFLETHGDKGCPITELKDMVTRYGADVTGEALNEMKANGGLTFKGGKLYGKMKKSDARFTLDTPTEARFTLTE